MKRVLAVMLITVVGIAAMAQHIESQQPLTKEDYQRKSKRQQTMAWICTGGGAALVISGLIVYSSENSYFPNQEVGTGLLIGGGVAVTAGVVLFLASARNKNKAAATGTAVRLKWENALTADGVAMKKNYFPALALNIRLK